jgi:hydrogenase nickel incorporation protein HypA/HybF
MHEYSLVQSLLERVAQEAAVHRAVAVHRVHVRIGSLAGVEAGLFTTAFEMLRPGTLCAGAELVLNREASVWSCPVCAVPVPADGALACPACGWPARLASGDALVLERVDLEVP